MILGGSKGFFTLPSVSSVFYFRFLTQMMHFLSIIFFLFGNLLFAVSAVSNDQLNEVAQSKQWHRLLHYKKSLPFLKIRSEVDGPDFFFSPEGKTNPLAELKASLQAYDQNIEVGKLKLHPKCAFPARFEFLRKIFHLTESQIKCGQFEEVLDTAKPESVTLVFSSAYPNNPASMFGHTFLRLNRKHSQGEKKIDMLDYGVSFAAAVAEDENPFAFIAFGLTGGYKGQFSYVPYYVKVNEYNNSESRDVWEYDLSLTSEETRFLLAHIWELETNGHFDYYFFDENCSYQMLTVIEAAKPEWELSDFLVSVIPTETIKKIMSVPGAVRNVQYRPSLRQKMVDKIETLASDQRETLSDILDRKKDPRQVRDPFVLDAAVASLFYEKNEREETWNLEKRNLQASLLIQRSKLGKVDASENIIQHEEGRPDLGHFAQRLSISPGYLSAASFKGEFQEIGIKSAYHDLLNNDVGFLRFSQIDFPQTSLRYFPKDNSLRLESLELLHITSLFPLSPIERRPSWKLQIGYLNSRETTCAFCKGFVVRGGIGASSNLFNERNILYGFLLAKAEAGKVFSLGYGFSPEGQLAMIFNPVDNYKTRFAVGVSYDLVGNQDHSWRYQGEWEHALSFSRSWELRAAFGFWGNASQQRTQPYQEGKLSLNYYF